MIKPTGNKVCESYNVTQKVFYSKTEHKNPAGDLLCFMKLRLSE